MNTKAKTKTKTTYISLEEKKKIIKRIKTIEGQARGVVNMIEDERYCGDIFIQLAAIRESVKSAANKILQNHIETSIVEEIKNNNNDGIEEITKLIQNIE